MRTPLGKIKWAIGNIRLALQQPPTPKHAKGQVMTWGILLAVVILNAGIMMLIDSMSWFTVGFTLCGIWIYTACLKWSIEGLSWAARSELRRAFDEIVANGR